MSDKRSEIDLSITKSGSNYFIEIKTHNGWKFLRDQFPEQPIMSNDNFLAMKREAYIQGIIIKEQ